MKIQKYSLERIGEGLLDPYDLFICSSSYEKRCQSIANHIDLDRINQALILFNNDLTEYIEANKVDIKFTNLKFLENKSGQLYETVLLIDRKQKIEKIKNTLNENSINN